MDSHNLFFSLFFFFNKEEISSSSHEMKNYTQEEGDEGKILS